MVFGVLGYRFLFFTVAIASGCIGGPTPEPEQGSRAPGERKLALVCGEDEDGDGIENCAERDDGAEWTDPEQFNGVLVSRAKSCHVRPKCGKIDELFEVSACERSDEELLQSGGWDFDTEDADLCDEGFGFRPGWSDCGEEFQLDTRGYIRLEEYGFHCFGVSGGGEQRGQCGSLYFHKQTEGIVTNGSKGCFFTTAGVYPIRWFYETTNEDERRSLRVSYCYGGEQECTPQEAIPPKMLRPSYSGCIPDSCASEGAECGEIEDGCGGTLDCDRQTGGCTGVETCGGGGEEEEEENRCGCQGPRCCRLGVDSDGDGSEDCEEVADNDGWTDPLVFNGMWASTSDVCHGDPDCTLVDELDEVIACEVSDEELLQYSGWDFESSEMEMCSEAYGFRPGWDSCEDEFQVDARGFIKLDDDGFHCFEVAGPDDGDGRGQCGAVYFDDEEEGVVDGNGRRCFEVAAGVYPIRWFYEATNEASVRALHVLYCFGREERCEPSEAIAPKMLRPFYGGDEELCVADPVEYTCTDLCRCSGGQGPCDDDGECLPGLACGEDNGQRFGAAGDEDRCWAQGCDIDPVGTGCGSPEEPCGYCPEDCINDLDDDQDGSTDCDDAECVGLIYCEPEECHNGIDDNQDGRTDCYDPDCLEDLECSCGNNVRQANSSVVPREGCDDGNNEGGDACSPECVPTVLVVRSENVTLEVPDYAPARVGIDSEGNLLMVWKEDAEDHWEIRARRFSRGGVALDAEDAPIVIADSIGLGWPAEPTVAGVAGGGWVVVWTSDSVDGSGSGVAYRMVAADGETGSVRRANQQTLFGQSSGRVATTDIGFVMVWTDESASGPGEPRARINGRMFDNQGNPLGDEMAVGTANAGDEAQPEVAANGNQWMAVWTNASDRSVRGRRFNGVTAVDLAEFNLGEETHSASVTAMSEQGDYAVAWTGIFEGEPGPGDDLAFATYAMLVLDGETPGSGDGARVVEVADGRPEQFPSVAALYPDVFLVGWQYGPVSQDGDFAIIDMSSGQWPGIPEQSALSDELGGDSNQQNLETTPTADGVWFTWTFDGLGSAQGVSNALMAYLLPAD